MSNNLKINKNQDLIYNFFLNFQTYIFSAFAAINNYDIDEDVVLATLEAIERENVPNVDNLKIDEFFFIYGLDRTYQDFFFHQDILTGKINLNAKKVKTINNLLLGFLDATSGNINSIKLKQAKSKRMSPDIKLNRRIMSIMNELETIKTSKNKIKIVNYIFESALDFYKEKWFENGCDRMMTLLINLMLLNTGLGFYFIDKANADEYLNLRKNFLQSTKYKSKLLTLMKQNLVPINEIHELVQQIPQHSHKKSSNHSNNTSNSSTGQKNWWSRLFKK